MSTTSFTCLNCRVRFKDTNLQRDHYKTDWHRYNLKRKVAELPPVTAEEFQKRVIQQKLTVALSAQETVFYCMPCGKHFGSEKSHDNHLNSKKHKDNVAKYDATAELKKENLVRAGGGGDAADVKIEDVGKDESDDDMSNVVEEVDSDEWDDETENPIAKNCCMFCGHESNDFVDNMKHMSVVHSFFVPDTEYIIDLEGLIMYLGAKISRDFICIWCNERGRTFYTLDAVRKHMIDKGHCKMLHEGLALAEYADFYDYSSSYPDNEEGMDIDEEISVNVLDGDEYQLVLPSGAVVGHRSLMRYYKQRLNPNRALMPVKTSNKKLHKVLAEYRSLGWSASQQMAVAKRARDIHHMKRQYQKWNMKLGVKANKLQRHFRPQVDF